MGAVEERESVKGGRERTRRGKLRQRKKEECCERSGEVAELSAFMICLSERVKTICQPPQFRGLHLQYCIEGIMIFIY